MKHFLIALLSAGLLVTSCQNTTESTETVPETPPATEEHAEHHGHGHHHGDANAYMHQMSFDSLVKRFENAERDQWQKPDAVIKSLGELNGKTVADLGAGTGYFAFRLAKAGAHVIALDIDQQFVDYMNERNAQSPRAVQQQVDVRSTDPNRADIGEGEIDLLLTVDTYHHFENRVAYFRDLKPAFKAGGTLVIIDFKPGDQPYGPPAEMKISPDKIKAELTEAGYTNITVDDVMLPHQFVLKAEL